MNELKYVNFYNSTLKAGYTNGVCLEDKNTPITWNDANVGYYLTPMFDTRADGGSYNRLIIDCGRVKEGLDNEQFLSLEGVKLEVIVAATDNDIIKSIMIENDRFEGGSILEFNQWLCKRDGIELRNMFRDMNNRDNFQHVYYVDAHDILLHNLHGRYVWVLVMFTSHSSTPPCCVLNGLRLEFPKYSFLDYFPEIYEMGQSEKDDFFTRYIAIFQSVFLDEEQNVDNLPVRLDYNLAPDSDIKKLAEWLGIDNSHSLFGVDNLRKMIRESELFQGKKGTREALQAMAELLTGKNLEIRECFECRKQENACNEYLDNGFCVENYYALEQKEKQVLADYFPLGAIIRRDKIAEDKIEERRIGEAMLELDKR